ncbi:oxidoreductase [Paramyrothecium foliicola]|nr:oxidoreductase [Paramyrothecium foliicola]
MASSNLNFNCALVTGGGGGIGKALATYFISKGKKVIIAGRTESNLKKTAQEIGAAAYYVFDQAVISSISDFVSRITTEHPDLDCLINNAAIQEPLKVQDDAAEFLQKADQEIDINIRGPMHLTLHLISHLKSKPSALIVNITSGLGFVPVVVLCPGYNASKAWMRFWTLNLRSQLRSTNVRVVEIAPPMVETDLHRHHEDPDNNKKEKNPISLSLKEFMSEVTEKLERGDEIIAAGTAARHAEKWWNTYGELYEGFEKSYVDSS